MDDEALRQLLAQTRTVAVVGLGNKPDRPAYRVAAFLQSRGVRILPVHPREREVLGEQAVSRLADLPVAVDIVDLFLRADRVAALLPEVAAAGGPFLWLQEGIVLPGLADRLAEYGLSGLQDRCLMKEWQRLLG